ncbi:uncharacterized protein IUM83_00999 [Phytophthora cinnamomi]|uniref:uncharacterized protein n=1 Tax=Phytophthora cinnamomi TaxID=4785 RepID=UPI00355AC436|nr:hypothetical protein IUM83_00999 [Phytophthora cinnamomi]
MGALLSLPAQKPPPPRQLQARLSPEVQLMAVKMRPLTALNGTTGTVEPHVRVRVDDDLQELAQLFRAMVSGDRRLGRYKVQLQ